MPLHLAGERVQVARPRVAGEAGPAGKAARAAATAASTSALPACGTRAIRCVVAGLITSNHSPLAGFTQLPPTNSPNSPPSPPSPPCFASHSRACLSDSGAGPYAIVWKISETVVIPSGGGARPNTDR